MDKEKVYKENIEQNGDKLLMMIVAEECGELIQVVSKLYRFRNTDMDCSGKWYHKYHKEFLRQHLIEEMADVTVMLEQLQRMYNITDDDINKWKESKIERLAKRLGIEEEEK